jgi:hypothetical protein
MLFCCEQYPYIFIHLIDAMLVHCCCRTCWPCWSSYRSIKALLIYNTNFCTSQIKPERLDPWMWVYNDDFFELKRNWVFFFGPAKNSSSNCRKKEKERKFLQWHFLLLIFIVCHNRGPFIVLWAVYLIWLQDQTKNIVDGRYYVIQHPPAQHPLETCYDSLVVAPL